MSSFVAIDFETANYSRTSACAVGLVHVRNRRIVSEKTLLIRPPQKQFTFTHIHGLTWAHVKDQPTFGELWPEIRAFIDKAEFLAAHNATFDRGVLHRCCETYDIDTPSTPFVCTVQLARCQWDVYPTKLPNVCSYLDIPLQHHDASSDSRACAKIVIAAEKDGWRI
jgi:DNA polymerase III subunit epsilon